MSDKKEVFALDLDTKEFTEKALQAKEHIDKIGNSDNLSGLVEGLLSVGKGVAAVGVAAVALKVSFDAVFEAEQIKQTNALFDEMAKSIGLAGDKLKSDLVGAAHGLAGDTDILKAANRAITTMGDSAARLPEIMDLARRYTKNFGGDLIENFERLNYAIASGSERILKQMGIVVDTDKALKEYAKSLGVGVDALTQHGRQQAIMNEALKVGQARIKDINKDNQTASELYKQLKVIIGQVGEMFVLAFEKLAGPAIRATLKALVEVGSEVKTTLASYIGEGAEKAEAKVKLLNDRLAYLNKELADIQANAAKQRGGADSILDFIFGGPDFDKKIAKVKEEIATVSAEVEKNQTQISQHEKQVESESVENHNNAVKEKVVNEEKAAHDRMRIEDEIFRMQEANNKLRLETAENEVQLVAAQAEQKLLIEQDAERRKAQLRQEVAEGKINNAEQVARMEEEINAQKEMRILQLEEEHKRQEDRMQENYLRKSKSVFDGVGRAAEVNAKKANRALNDMGKTGTMVMGVIQHRGEEAFMAFGASAINHSQSASQIMRGFFLNALADMAEAQGKLYLAAGFVDPSKFAAGAALLVLSGALRAMAGSAGGGGGGGFGGGDSGGGGSGGYYNDNSSASSEDPNQVKSMEKKTVNVQIMGNYFETEQTKTRLMEMIRESTDATDFNYSKIGGQ